MLVVYRISGNPDTRLTYWAPIAKLFSDIDRETVVEALDDFEDSMAQQREYEMAELEGEEGEGETGG